VIKFCTQVGYINSSNSQQDDIYHPQKGRGYGYVTVLKFCRLTRDAARRAFCQRHAAELGLLIIIICWEKVEPILYI